MTKRLLGYFSVVVFGVIIIIVWALYRPNTNRLKCNCLTSLDAKGIGIRSSPPLGDITFYTQADGDTLVGNVDSIAVKVFELETKFDEQVEVLKKEYTEYYKSNKIYYSSERNSNLGHNYINESAENTYSTDGKVIKQIASAWRYGERDAAVIKYEYDNCDNTLSRIKIYESAGSKISEISISTVQEGGIIEVLLYNYSGESTITLREQIFLDDNCKIVKTRRFSIDYNHIVYVETFSYNERGLVSNYEYCYFKDKFDTLPPSMSDEEFKDQEIEGLHQVAYEYKYDSRNNWIVKKLNNRTIIHRTLYYKMM